MHEIFDAFDDVGEFRTTGAGHYNSLYHVTSLATNAIASVGCNMASLIESLGLSSVMPETSVDQRLALLWFASSIKPLDWEMPPIWDAIAGDYQTKDGWIKLHTNLPHHRAVACNVLGVDADRAKVKVAVSTWSKDYLEQAIVSEGGVAAAMRTRSEWFQHPQGQTVATEPLIHWTDARERKIRDWQPTIQKPLKGLRVLDLTRVLAGPVATRILAGFGAEVLRIDPPDWEEDNVVPDITLGKRCARLDLKSTHDKEIFHFLLSKADVLVHGYRHGALDGLGFNEEKRRVINPGLVEASLNAYGWVGPWIKRRGFDSLVQMSSGIAAAGMAWAKSSRPTPLPVQALDHATGYLMAAAVIKSLDDHVRRKPSASARLSLARTAELLMNYEQNEKPNDVLGEPYDSDYSLQIEQNSWGQTRRLKPALRVGETKLDWPSPACVLGSNKPDW
jgi:crotonobetainyl-CoA:carnitine CoA-transferase CaiB-like acyl-CoA transferase